MFYSAITDALRCHVDQVQKAPKLDLSLVSALSVPFLGCLVSASCLPRVCLFSSYSLLCLCLVYVLSLLHCPLISVLSLMLPSFIVCALPVSSCPCFVCAILSLPCLCLIVCDLPELCICLASVVSLSRLCLVSAFSLPCLCLVSLRVLTPRPLLHRPSRIPTAVR